MKSQLSNRYGISTVDSKSESTPLNEEQMADKPDIFSFRGRIGRKTFWLTWITLFVTSVAMSALVELIETSAVLSFVLLPIGLWISIAMQVKRWHDRDKSGWMVLINFIPILGQIWTLVNLGFLRGTLGPNRYGKEPWKDEGASAEEKRIQGMGNETEHNRLSDYFKCPNCNKVFGKSDALKALDSVGENTRLNIGSVKNQECPACGGDISTRGLLEGQFDVNVAMSDDVEDALKDYLHRTGHSDQNDRE